MLTRVAIARRVGALSRILLTAQPFSWANARRPGHYSTYEPTLAYAVRRHDPELVGPASQTPRETKRLSDLDNMDIVRAHMSLAFFYRGREDGVDPAGVIRRALGEALVHYYPMAGRVREIEGRKLVVDCTGEGVLFVQADADVQLTDLEAAGLRPPFPCWDQLLFDVEGSSGLLNCPLLLIQITRLLCGGFVLAVRFNHTICDGFGIVQFINAISELARGLPSIMVTPVWSRELLQGRNPPPPVPVHTAGDLNVLPRPHTAGGDMVVRPFTFSATDVAAIKQSLPLLLRNTATTFETLTAFLWRAHTKAHEVPLGEDATLGFAVNFRGFAEMSLPAGYYGNTVVTPTVRTDAAVLRHGSLSDVVALVRQAKDAVTTKYVRTMVDEVVLLGRQIFIPANVFGVSDARRLGFERVNFGWGEPVFAGPADTVSGGCFFIAVKDRDGENAIAVSIMLPRLAMHRFTAEVILS